MAYNKTQTFDNNPNTGAVFNTYRSDNSQYFDSTSAHAGGANGVGAIKERSVSKIMVSYKPYETSINTMAMLMGQQETATSVIHEWFEDDELMPDEAITGTPVTSSALYLTDAGYTGGALGATGKKLSINYTSENANLFHTNMLIRYATSAGTWEMAMITAITGVDGADVGDALPNTSVDDRIDLTLASVDGSDLAAAASVGGVVQYIATSFPADGEPTVNPRGNTPKGYYTQLQKLKAEAKVTERDRNEELINPNMGGLARAMMKTYEDMNYQIEKNFLYGKGGKINIGTNQYYTAPGIYTTAKATNYHTSDLTTSGLNDSTKFKNALSEFIQWNFGAESGGSPRRQGFIDGRFAGLLSQAYEDKIQVMGTEYIGGLRANKWVDNNGEIDFIKAPIFEKVHPVVGGSLRNSGTPRAVCLLVDVPQQLVTVSMQGEELNDDMFKEHNQDESDVYRVRATMGRYTRLKQYSAVFEEVAE